ncbi:hypothetical protein GCM10009600_38080 [Oerskovia paurometabola]
MHNGAGVSAASRQIPFLDVDGPLLPFGSRSCRVFRVLSPGRRRRTPTWRAWLALSARC